MDQGLRLAADLVSSRDGEQPLEMHQALVDVARELADAACYGRHREVEVGDAKVVHRVAAVAAVPSLAAAVVVEEELDHAEAVREVAAVAFVVLAAAHVPWVAEPAVEGFSAAVASHGLPDLVAV